MHVCACVYPSACMCVVYVPLYMHGCVCVWIHVCLSLSLATFPYTFTLTSTSDRVHLYARASTCVAPSQSQYVSNTHSPGMCLTRTVFLTHYYSFLTHYYSFLTHYYSFLAQYYSFKERPWPALILTSLDPQPLSLDAIYPISKGSDQFFLFGVSF